MSWFRIDDKFHSHSKVLMAGNAATGLYTRCGAWSCDQGTDGMIPRHVARSFGSTREITSLVSCGLWAEVETGYVMPDFLDFNPSAAEVEAKRQARAEAGAKGGQRSGETRRSKGEANASGLLDVCFDGDEANTNPVPSRPVPSHENKSSLNSESVGTTEEDDLVRSIIGEIARLRAASRKPDSRDAWVRTVIKNFHTDELPALMAFLEERPEIRDENQWEAAARIFEMYRVNRSAS